MTSQLDMFGGDDPVVNVTVARSESMNALELLMTWKGDLTELMDILPASVTLAESERLGLAMKRAWRCYCLSPRSDGRPGSWPVVCIHPGDKNPDEHTAYIVTCDGTVTGHVARSLFSQPPWRIVTEHAIFDMAGRYIRSRQDIYE